MPEVHGDWDKHLGPALEAPLRSVAIRLLDGKYVVEMAEEGRAMQPRQLLPPEAFISLDEIKAEGVCFSGLRIFCISYPWLEVCQSLDTLPLSYLHSKLCGCLAHSPTTPTGSGSTWTRRPLCSNSSSKREGDGQSSV
eukprot:5696003-Prymnesium_polylepis.1